MLSNSGFIAKPARNAAPKLPLTSAKRYATLAAPGFVCGTQTFSEAQINREVIRIFYGQVRVHAG
jgi:hypothetical protein